MSKDEFNVDNFYHITKAGYRYELNRLVTTVNSSQFRKLLLLFTKKKKFIESLRRGEFKKLILNKKLNNGFSMDAGNISNEDQMFYKYVDLAAECAFFDGWTIPVSQLSYNQIDDYLSMLLSKGPIDKGEAAKGIAERLNRADTMRVSMALKLLGLLPAESHRFRQLSLGAFHGNRDIQFMHQHPLIVPTAPLNNVARPVDRPVSVPPLAFRTVSHDAKDIVLIDIDPSIAERYAEMNITGQGRVLAMNCDVLKGLDALNIEIKAGNKKLRDLVVLFRLEPMMLPDLDVFFKKLSNVINNNAKFIVTVGAGDDEEAYRRRKSKMDEIVDKFLNKGFRVERLKWCNGVTPEQQRELPLMGIGNYSSYDIIYCDMIKNRL